MQYQTLEEQLNYTIEILKQNVELMNILDFIHNLSLPNYYIAAGSVFQTIWNYLDRKPLNYGIKDIDVIYYNKDDLSIETDIKYYDLINKFCINNGYNYKIDVSNEARMHIWKKEMFHMDVEQYLNSEDAINYWIATIHAIGITKDSDDLKIYAPYGLSDIYNRTIRPIKHKYNTEKMYVKKVNSWKKRFNNLNIIKW